MFAEPADGGVTCLVDGDGTLFLGSHYLCLLLQSTDDTVNGVEEVLARYLFLIMAGRNKRSLIAYIGNVGT